MSETEIGDKADLLSEGAKQSILVAAVCTMIVGVVLAVWPHKPLVAAELLTGAYLLFNAVVQLSLTFGTKIAVALRSLLFFSAALSALLALVCFSGGNTPMLLSVWVGVAWVARGICHATVSVWVDELPGRGRQESFGLCTMVGGIALAVMPMASLTAFGWIVGVAVIVVSALELASVLAGQQELDRSQQWVPSAGMRAGEAQLDR
ncbi:DUF308 domain-containing protein [Nocardia callitridis]|uniref:Uncharacterized protein n=1 Tax=Nocardia callitridis TaxID=648753 RepID=A0ABP9K5S8_9NOCA